MNGPTTIYHLKPVFKIPQELDLPACMYKMKNLVACVKIAGEHMEDKKELLAGILDKKPVPELASLEARWDSIIQQLTDLKMQMESIKKSVTESSKLSGCIVLDSTTLNNLKVFQGAVINASPSNPPYSLLYIKHLYKSSLPISIYSHVHSSILSLPDKVECFTEEEPDANCALKLVLIWKKDIKDAELVINPLKQLPIKGEVNILRFLARSGLKLLHYPSNELIDTIHTNSVLDICHRLLHVTTAKEKASLLKNLNAKLGRSSYFGGEEINISDIAAWSALKQINVNLQDLNQNLVKWYARIDKIVF